MTRFTRYLCGLWIIHVSLADRLEGGDNPGEVEHHGPQAFGGEHKVQEWTVHNFPDPQRDLGLCGRGEKPSWICDPHGVFTQAQLDMIDSTVERTCVQTPCPCACECKQFGCAGYGMAVAVLEKIPLPQNTPRTEEHTVLAMEAWADKLQSRTWNYGDCDNDIVIIYSKIDAQVHTSFGSKAAQIFEAPCRLLAQNKSQHIFDAGLYADGIKQLIIEYRRILNNNSGCGPLDFRGEKMIMQTMLILILAVCGLVAFVGCCVFATKDGSHCPRAAKHIEEESDRDPITRVPPSPIISRGGGEVVRYAIVPAERERGEEEAEHSFISYDNARKTHEYERYMKENGEKHNTPIYV